jgi:hypothetical protein
MRLLAAQNVLAGTAESRTSRKRREKWGAPADAGVRFVSKADRRS